MVRDYDPEEDDYLFGFSGGRQYLNEVVFPSNESNQAQENKITAKYLKETCGNEPIPCCLIPHPGKSVAKEDILEKGVQKHLVSDLTVHYA